MNKNLHPLVVVCLVLTFVLSTRAETNICLDLFSNQDSNTKKINKNKGSKKATMGETSASIEVVGTQVRRISLKTARDKHVLSAREYIKLIRQQQQKLGKILPEFILPSVEQGKTALWKGVPLGQTPKLVKTSLPDHVRLIDHQLIEAALGSVKSADAARLVHARLVMPWKSHKFSDTNIGFPRRALFDNLFRPEGGKYLTSQRAKAVIIDLHGGGTKTTGHHVAITKLDAFNPHEVDVISVELPGHGEGARSVFTSLEFFQYLEAFRNKYIPKDVPVFISGHSLGGVYVNLFMIHSAREGSTFKESFAGLMALSPVADLNPGKTMSEKFLDGQVIEMDPQVVAKMALDDQLLHANLTANGKLGLYSMAAAGRVIAELDWAMPSHRGAEYLPTFMSIGRHDFLMVGNERQYKQYWGGLSNVTSYYFGRSRIFGPGVEPRPVVEKNLHLLDPTKNKKGEDMSVLQRANIRDHGLQAQLAKLVLAGKEVVRHYYGESTMAEAKDAIDAFAKIHESLLTTRTENGKRYMYPLARGEVRTVKENNALGKRGYNESQMEAQGDIVEAITKYVDEMKNITKLMLERNRDEVDKSIQNKDIETSPYVDIQEWSGEVAKIGHMTSDHLAPQSKSTQPEQYSLMLAFMEKVLKQPLPRTNGDKEFKGEEEKISFLQGLLHKYFNNLAFRLFVKDQVVVRKKPLGKMQELLSRSGEIRKALASLDKGQNPEEVGFTLDGKVLGKEELQALSAKTQAMTKQIYIPEKGEPGSEMAQANVARRQEINIEIKNLDSEKKTHMASNETLEKSVSEKKARLQAIFDKKIVKPEDVMELEQKIADLFEVLRQHDVEQEKKHNEFYAELIERGEFTPENIDRLTPELKDYYKVYTRDFKEYAKLQSELEKLLAIHAMEGRYGEEALRLSVELYGFIGDIRQKGLRGNSGLAGNLERHNEHVANLGKRIINLNREQDLLVAEYIQQVTKNYWKVDIYAAEDILNSPLEVVLNYKSELLKIISDWNEIWKDKEDDQGVSPY